MRICDELQIPRGVTAAVGGGGKTTLLNRLATELAERGRVLVTTTTRIRRPAFVTLIDPTANELRQAFARERVVAIGSAAQGEKLSEPSLARDDWTQFADYVLVEADGSRGLPMKAHAAHEPQIPDNTALTIGVIGASGFGQSIEAAAHRPELFAEMVGAASTAQIITPVMTARAVESANGLRKGAKGRFLVVINQNDDEQIHETSAQCAAQLRGDVFLTALKTRPDWLEHWRNGACWW